VVKKYKLVYITQLVFFKVLISWSECLHANSAYQKTLLSTSVVLKWLSNETFSKAEEIFVDISDNVACNTS